ncbi:MAG: type II toxin-antitoxin system HipA family toxin [Paludibacteraceae bacterium]|nr:type II toxin-antitoxin system HipA family toxin [Paludibacteraceae bacterium]
MVDVAQVKIYGIPMGIFRLDNRYDNVQFEYDNDFVSKGLEPSPLMMPTLAGRIYSFADLGRETFKGLPGLLADSLPDTYGRALFDRWLSLIGRTSSNIIETLCFLGKRCMGALEFEPAIDVDYNLNAKVEIDSLVDVAREALQNKESFGVNINEDKKAAIAEILRLGTSAGGQRAKAIIAYNKTTGEVLSGQTNVPKGFDYYIIKLDGVSATTGFRETENYGRLEYSFYKLINKCGIEMSDCSLIEENGRAHFLTKRFDRENGKKIHMQTLCGLAHYDYRLHRAFSYEQAFNVMRRLKLPYSDAEEMFRRMVLNVIIRNQDDHTKNISFLMDEDGIWKLSPAYDMGYSYNPNGGWTSTHQMSINGKFDEINRKDLLKCGVVNNIKNASIIIDEICDTASLWPTIAKECDVPENMIEKIFNNFLIHI